MILNDARWSMHQLNGWRRGRSAERHQYRFVAFGAAMHRLPLPPTAELKQKFDLEATAQGAQLVVRKAGFYFKVRLLFMRF